MLVFVPILYCGIGTFLICISARTFILTVLPKNVRYIYNSSVVVSAHIYVTSTSRRLIPDTGIGESLYRYQYGGKVCRLKEETGLE